MAFSDFRLLLVKFRTDETCQLIERLYFCSLKVEEEPDDVNTGSESQKPFEEREKELRRSKQPKAMTKMTVS